MNQHDDKTAVSMTSLIGFTVFGVDWVFLKPFIVLGLALGGVYALSGVGLVVLYRATGVLNIAFGAVGAAGALIAYYLIQHTGTPALAGLPGLHCVRRRRQSSVRGDVRSGVRGARSARQDDGNARGVA